MEIKEIDGKKFIELKENRIHNRKTVISIIFLVLMVIAIAALLNVTYILVKNKDIIKNDPMIYGMGLHNFTDCKCLDTSGKSWDSTETGFIYFTTGKNWVNHSAPENQVNFTRVKEMMNGAS